MATDTEQRIVASNQLAIAIRDGYPISAGHTLIIPRRHEKSFFKLNSDEKGAVLELLDAQQALLSKVMALEDFNIGINDGPLAGQTVPHCHIHLIPRRDGDVSDPRGGIRWIIPDKADYWT